MTPAEVIAALHGPRLPAGTAALGPGALLAAFGLGLLIAVVAFALVSPVLRVRARAPRPPELTAGLAALPAEARPLAAAQLFARLGAAPPQAVAAALYRPGAGLDLGALGPALAAAWDRARPEARRAVHV